MTGRMLAEIKREIVAERPDRALVYGDTNSTLSGTLASAKLHVSAAHVDNLVNEGFEPKPVEIFNVGECDAGSCADIC
jgi:UDP-N-acetylglucosamine 2-epimerase